MSRYAKAKFVKLAQRELAVPRNKWISFGSVRGSARKGLTFTYKARGSRSPAQKGYALKYKGKWFFAPASGPEEKVTKADLGRVSRAFLSHFDQHTASTLRAQGKSASQIKKIRKAVSRPNHMALSWETHEGPIAQRWERAPQLYIFTDKRGQKIGTCQYNRVTRLTEVSDSL